MAHDDDAILDEGSDDDDSFTTAGWWNYEWAKRAMAGYGAFCQDCGTEVGYEDMAGRNREGPWCESCFGSLRDFEEWTYEFDVLDDETSPEADPDGEHDPRFRSPEIHGDCMRCGADAQHVLSSIDGDFMCAECLADVAGTLLDGVKATGGVYGDGGDDSEALFAHCSQCYALSPGPFGPAFDPESFLCVECNDEAMSMDWGPDWDDADGGSSESALGDSDVLLDAPAAEQIWRPRRHVTFDEDTEALSDANFRMLSYLDPIPSDDDFDPEIEYVDPLEEFDGSVSWPVVDPDDSDYLIYDRPNPAAHSGMVLFTVGDWDDDVDLGDCEVDGCLRSADTEVSGMYFCSDHYEAAGPEEAVAGVAPAAADRELLDLEFQEVVGDDLWAEMEYVDWAIVHADDELGDYDDVADEATDEESFDDGQNPTVASAGSYTHAWGMAALENSEAYCAGCGLLVEPSDVVAQNEAGPLCEDCYSYDLDVVDSDDDFRTDGANVLDDISGIDGNRGGPLGW